jgi:hypothetical protein
MAGKPILETQRLLLREFDEGDAEPFYALGSDPAIIRYTGDPGGGLASIEQALEILRSRPIGQPLGRQQYDPAPAVAASRTAYIDGVPLQSWESRSPAHAGPSR